MEITYRVALERNGQVIFDSDMDALLRAIDAYQNLHTATKQLNLSYRHAWDRLRTSEERLGIKLVDNCIRGRGMQVTSEARSILSKFDTLKRNVASSINWPSLTMTVQNAIIT
jgi:molybdate transport system regulatory protein